MLDLEHKLAPLRDLHLHSAVVLDDPAVWAGLGVGAVVAGVAAAVVGRTVLRRRSLRREAEMALEHSCALPPAERLVEQAKLLRRLARTCADPASASLHGDAWLAALDKLFSTTFFTSGAGRCFAQDLYARSSAHSDAQTTDALRTLLARLPR